MTKRIFRSILLAAAAILLASLIIIMGVLYEYFNNVQLSQLREELSLAAAAVEQGREAYLETLESDDYRVTWVAPDGSVLYDTRVDASNAENHADREEIREAFETGTGESQRFSGTLTEKTIYHAKRLSDGTVLRISVSRYTVIMLLLGILQPIAVVLILAIVLSALLAKRMAKSIVKPLNELDLEHPLDNDVYGEISPLLNRINQQRLQISEQLEKLQRRTDEFEQITGSMKEGLVLIDNKGAVISINPAAQQIFSTDKGSIGQDFLTVNRSSDLIAAIERAMEQGHGSLRSERGGRIYQFDISRIESGGGVIGAVLLAFEVTEQALAERGRREFTANVSHELKTPLQSIAGSAELIEAGLVKKEDVPRFIHRIRTEAARMMTLIADILRLSQLDEGEAMPMEKVDLRTIAEETAESLEEAAAAKRISLRVTGGSAQIQGVRRLISEILFNLCDNAIKYNREGGSVNIDVKDSGEQAVLTVSDTGIGVPPEHQARIFERFYRVDKSHSRQSGGTGLGLSIVKHAALYHNAKIDLRSDFGEGTTITVTFPKGRV